MPTLKQRLSALLRRGEANALLASPTSPTSPDWPDSPVSPLHRLFWVQAQHTQLEVLPGPGRLARWSVPEGTRHPLTGAPLHDDLVVSAALVAVLEEQPFGRAASQVIRPYDPLQHLSL